MPHFFEGLNPVDLCWLIFVALWLVSALFVKKSVSRRPNSSIIFRIALMIIIISLIKLGKSSWSRFVLPSGSSFHASSTLTIIASILTVLGLLGAIWSRIKLGTNWSGYVTYKEGHELVTTGPYRFVRHPIYTSMIMMFIGTALFYQSLPIAFFLAVIATFLILRMKREEEIMTKLFGKEYADYVRTTKKIVPFIY